MNSNIMRYYIHQLTKANKKIPLKNNDLEVPPLGGGGGIFAYAE